MAEYIDRQAAFDAIPNTKPDLFENCRNCKLLDKDDVIHFLENIPAADVVERKRGHWILRLPADQDNNATWECSVCHAGEVHVPIVEVPFCWKCGADMRQADAPLPAPYQGGE